MKVDKLLWNYRNPQYPNAYSGGSVTFRKRLRLSWTQSGSAWHHGRLDGAMPRCWSNWSFAWVWFTAFRGHVVHLGIGRLTISWMIRPVVGWF